MRAPRGGGELALLHPEYLDEVKLHRRREPHDPIEARQEVSLADAIAPPVLAVSDALKRLQGRPDNEQ